VSGDANDHVSGGRDSFFSDEEMQLPRASRPEPGQKSLSRDCVLNEIDVSIEMEPERVRADPAHRLDRGHVPCFAASDQSHGGARARRFRHTDRHLGRRDGVEAMR
jgi:hypothetical protein